MKQIYSLLIAGILITNAGFAQKTPAKPVKQTVKDTFAINLLNTVDKLLAMATNEKLTGKDMVGEFIKVSYSTYAEWHALVNLPRSIQTTCTQDYTDRSKGITSWSWQATILKKETGSLSDIPPKERAEKVLQHFNTKNLNFKGDNFIYRVSESDTLLYISIKFLKGLHNTASQVMDSLDKLYRPLLFKKQTAEESKKWLDISFSVEGIDKDVSMAYYKKLLPEVADKDIDAAFKILMAIHNSEEDSKILLKVLTYTQQEQIRTIARKVVEDYYAQSTPKTTQADVVVARKKEIEKANVPADPCEREIWELNLKPGNYINGNGWVGQITGYSCGNNTYTIAWYDAKAKRISLAKNVTVAETSAYSISYSAPFMICRNCQGEGHSLEYEWYQVNVASSTYARSNKQNKVPCGACGSKGCIVVR